MKLEILIRPVCEFRTRNDIALHSLEPSFNQLLQLIEDAEKDMFELIVIYTNKTFWAMTNLKANSTWNKLLKCFDDVRAGEVGFKHGTSIGDGFTLYLEEVS